MRLYEISSNQSIWNTLAISLDKWFYAYHKRSSADDAISQLESLNIPTELKQGTSHANRVILIDKEQLITWKAGTFKPLHAYESWTFTNEDPTGYIGFVRPRKQWYSLYFSNHITSSDIIINLFKLGSNKEFADHVTYMQNNDIISDNINTLWSGDDNGPINEIIVKSNNKFYQPKSLIGYKSYATHKSPFSGQIITDVESL